MNRVDIGVIFAFFTTIALGNERCRLLPTLCHQTTPDQSSEHLDPEREAILTVPMVIWRNRSV